MAGFATYDKGGGVPGSTVYADNVDFTGITRTNTITTNGQLIIGATTANAGGNHINIGTITSPDASITVGFSSPNITLQVSAGAGGFPWNDVSGAFSPLKSNGYFITGTATGTLPAVPAQGDTIKFFVDHASQFLTIDAPGTQLIRLGSLVTSAGGTAVSTAQGDSVELTYRASDTCWCAIAGFTGTWLIS